AIHWDGGADRSLVTVYDIAGHRVWAAEAANHAVPWGGNANGVYVVRIVPRSAGGAAVVGKIVVVR
ncbi:MAG TPA: hypothetical protein VMF29_02440, partial [Candidatus Edwardsbacteria bacterium]|nr:hypothetical protein [Candidatus Edwardsbacteria bacterium]